MNLVMLALNTKLALSIVTCDEDLALLCHHYGSILSTTDTFYDDILCAQTFKYWCSWLVD